MAEHVHATSVVLAGHGVLISGPSGAGKTSLALALLVHMRIFGVPAQLISDDQTLIEVHDDAVRCFAPRPIAGLVEVRGVGPVPIEAAPSAPVRLMVELVEPEAVERLPDPVSVTLLGHEVRSLRLPRNDRQMAVLAVAATLSLPPFKAN